jgi:hypothetical protein
LNFVFIKSTDGNGNVRQDCGAGVIVSYAHESANRTETPARLQFRWPLERCHETVHNADCRDRWPFARDVMCGVLFAIRERGVRTL